MIAKRFAIFVLILLGLFGQVVPAFALEFPAPVGYVNDFANILSSETKQTLEQQLAQLEEESLVELVVVTVKSLEGEDLNECASRLFEAWGIGKKNEENGVLFLIASDERLMRIEPGYGLEPILPDAEAGRILDTYVVPAFKMEEYDKGISEGTEAIIKAVRGEDIGLDEDASSDSESEDGGGVWILFFIGTVFLSYLSSFLSRSKRWWPGGVIGAVLGVLLGIFLASIVASILAAVVLGILGLVFDFILSKNYKERKDKGLPTSFWGSGGGFFSGGKSSGGGGSFGGFGGGSSGGGGASRGW